MRQLKKRITKVELSTTGPGVVENEIDTKLYQAVDKILSQTREKMTDLAPRGQAHQTIINVTNEGNALLLIFIYLIYKIKRKIISAN